MKLEVQIQPPTPPNFIVIEIAGKIVSVPIEELTREKAKEYADMVHASIMKHHGKRGKELKDKKNETSENGSIACIINQAKQQSRKERPKPIKRKKS